MEALTEGVFLQALPSTPISARPDYRAWNDSRPKARRGLIKEIDRYNAALIGYSRIQGKTSISSIFRHDGSLHSISSAHSSGGTAISRYSRFLPIFAIRCRYYHKLSARGYYPQDVS